MAPEKESPGALAGATGANSNVVNSLGEVYRERRAATTQLCDAIALCPPDLAVPILAEALDHLRPGQPVTAFRSLMVEAESWAAFATRAELKCYVLAAFNAMRTADQAAFLGFVQRGAAA